MKGLNAGLAAALLVLSLTGGCKKDESPAASNNPNPGTCNFTTNVIATDGVTRDILRAVCHVLGTSYFAEFHTDTSAAPTGVAMIFSGTVRPAPGTYNIVTDVSQVAAGTVYVEYYDPANAWQGTTGTVTVADGGGQVVITFCSLTLTGAGTKVVSVRATTNL